MPENKEIENTKLWIKEICNAINSKEYKDEYPNSDFIYYNKIKHPKELINEIVINSSKYNYLNYKGLINRGFCPVTGKKINQSAMQWGMYGRNVIMSKEGLESCKNYDKISYIEVTGKSEDDYERSIKERERLKNKVYLESRRLMSSIIFNAILKVIALVGIITLFFIKTSGWGFVAKIILIVFLFIFLIGKKRKDIN